MWRTGVPAIFLELSECAIERTTHGCPRYPVPVEVKTSMGSVSPISPVPQLLTPAEVAQTLNVKVARIYEAVADRRLRAVKVGRLLRFRPQDIEAFLERHMTVR